MKNDKLRIWTAVRLLLDSCCLVVTYFLAYHLRFRSSLNQLPLFRIEGIYSSLEEYAEKLIILVPLYLLISTLFELFSQQPDRKSRAQIVAVIRNNTIGISVFLLYLYLTNEYDVSRLFLLVFFLLNSLLSTGFNLLIFKLRRVTDQGVKLNRQ